MTEQIDISFVQKLQVDANFDSTLIKLLYAFVWQEWVIGDNPAIYDPAVNEFGANLIPTINGLANAFNNFPVYDQDLQASSETESCFFFQYSFRLLTS